jgi:hypothetical protein
METKRLLFISNSVSRVWGEHTDKSASKGDHKQKIIIKKRREDVKTLYSAGLEVEQDFDSR